jgi:hypothetical protein
VSDAEPELRRILALARVQRPDPMGWSLAVNVDWLERFYFDSGVSRKLDALPSGELGACASFRAPTRDDPAATVTSIIRPRCEQLWTAQLAWIEGRAEDAGAATVRVVSECLTDDEKLRWADVGYDLVFEELAMERRASRSPATRIPDGRATPRFSSGVHRRRRRALRSTTRPSGPGPASPAGPDPSGSTGSPGMMTSFPRPRSARSGRASPRVSWSAARAGSTRSGSHRLTAASGSRAGSWQRRCRACERSGAVLPVCT